MCMPNISTMTDYNSQMGTMYSPQAMDSLLAMQESQRNQPKYIQHLNAKLQSLRKEIASMTLRN